MDDRKFSRAGKRKYTLEEKDALGKLCEKYKLEYDEKLNSKSGKITYNEKRKKHTNQTPREGYVAKAVREFYSDLKDVKHDDSNFRAAICLGKRCYEQVIKSKESGEIIVDPSKSKYRKAGAGRKTTIPDVREALFEWFIDIRGTLKARLPRKMFKTQCKIFYEQWLSQQSKEVAEDKKIVFSNRWIRNWMREYGVSLKHPNKRFQIKQTDREERVADYLKNIWTVRKFFLDNFGVDPPVINGDQMPLHRNESSSQKTLTFTGMDTYVKENYNLSRERVTVFTQLCSDTSVTLKPEFVFKGKGTRTELQPPEGIKFNWAPKGSYRLEQMLRTISNLPNRFNIFSPKNYAIYVLDDYSVHLMPEIKEALLKRGYVSIIIGGGVTGDIQINDTDLHCPLKAKYRELEQNLMLEQLRADPKKIPQPSRDDMMRMLAESFDSLKIDVVKHFKALWVTNALDGSEDYLVSERIMALVGSHLKEFRDELMKNKSPKSLKGLLRLITPPKGVKRKDQQAMPFDEGLELFDCEGQLVQSEEGDDGDSNDGDSDDRDSDDGERYEDQDTVTSEAVATGEENITQYHNIIMLADLCEDSDLHKDAVFLDQLGKLLLDAETTINFLPHLTAFKRNYITARRSVKRRIQCSREGNQENNDNQSEAEDDNQPMAEEDYPNLFENLFD